MGTRRRGHHSRPNHMPRPRTWRARRSRTARSLPPLLRPPTRRATGQKPLPATPARIGWASCVRPRRRTGPPRRGPPTYPGGPRGIPHRGRTANCRGRRRPRRLAAGRNRCPSGSRYAPNRPPGMRWPRTCGRAVPGAQRYIRRSRRPRTEARGSWAARAAWPPAAPRALRRWDTGAPPGRCLAPAWCRPRPITRSGRARAKNARTPMPGWSPSARPGPSQPLPPTVLASPEPGPGPPRPASRPTPQRARRPTPPLKPPTPSLPSQPGTDSGGFRGTAQASFPFAARPATKPGAAGTWQPNAGAGPFPAATDTPAAGTGLPGTGSAEPGGPAPWGAGSSTVSAADASGAGSTFPQEGGPSADNPQPASGVPQLASGVPPWGITDSPSAPAEGTVQADAEPTAPGPLSDAPAAGTGNAETGDSTETFAAVDPAAERSFPRAHPGDSSESVPATRPCADDDAFRLFPPVRETDNHPPAPPATGDQD